METQSKHENKWNIACGRQKFPDLVKAAHISGMRLIFNRHKLVAAVVGRESVEALRLSAIKANVQEFTAKNPRFRL